MAKQIRQNKERHGGSVEITELDELLGPPPLLPNESLEDYEGLQAGLRAKIVPQDVLEEIWLRDVLDLQWEVLRMRRLKARLLANSSPSGLESLLHRRVNYSDVGKFVDAWGRGDKEDIKEIELLLKSRGLGLDDVDAHSLLKRLEPLESIDRMISQAEARRNNALREIERAREAAARRLRAALSDEDGSVIYVASPEGSS
jgi:hypothetical protein